LYRVEFIGVPGSGKTTIRRKLIEGLKKVDKEKYLSVEEVILDISRNEIDKVYRIILNLLPRSLALRFSNTLLNRTLFQYNAQNRFLAEWGKLLESFLGSSALDNMPLNDREIVISSLMEVGSLYECINHGCLSDETVVFFEEGFIQKSLMFVSASANRESEKISLSTYLDNTPLPDLVIYVSADLASCYERMLSRPGGLTKRLQRVDKDGILNFLESCDSHLRRIVCWLRKNRQIGLLEINNDQKMDTVLYDLQHRVEAMLERSRHEPA